MTGETSSESIALTMATCGSSRSGGPSRGALLGQGLLDSECLVEKGRRRVEFAQADIADLPRAPAACLARPWELLPSPIPTPPPSRLPLGLQHGWVGHKKTLRQGLSSWEDWPLGNVCVLGQKSWRN